MNQPKQPNQDAQFPQPPYPYYPYHADDEISLVDLAKILVRRKLWFFLTWLLVVSLAVAYGLLTGSQTQGSTNNQDRFAYTTTMVIGYKTPTVFIEPMSAIQTLIKDAYMPLVQQRDELNRFSVSIHFQERRNINEEGSNILQLATRASSDQQSFIEELHKEIAEKLIDRHQFIADQLLKQAADSVSDHMGSVLPTSLATLAIPLKLKQSPSETNTTNTKLIIIIGIVLGFVLGIIVAFFAEFVSLVKTSLKEDT